MRFVDFGVCQSSCRCHRSRAGASTRASNVAPLSPCSTGLSASRGCPRPAPRA